jgi:hypothetical protein
LIWKNLNRLMTSKSQGIKGKWVSLNRG